jgi:hypothetical protein
MEPFMTRRRLLLTTGVALLGSAVPLASEAKEPSGSVTIDETQLAFIFSGQIGGGELDFRGRSYDFKIGGLGIGGYGISNLRAVGEVYDLKRVADFPGVYGEVRKGYAIGWQGDGHLWMQNPNNVVLHLRTAREGLMLTLGASGVVISMD